MPRSIIIDTDPGVDDVLAILLALASPKEIDVKLISIVFGNTHAPTAHANLLKIYHILEDELKSPEAGAGARERYPTLSAGKEAGKSKIKLAVGADGPIGGEKAVAAYFHGKDGFSNLSETHPHFTPPARHASEPHARLDLDDRPSWEVMLEILEQEEENSVVVVAVGPLTNLAQALRISPKTFSRLGGIIWMGGALDVSGNTSPSAEFNCFADPYAAASIIEASKSGLVKLVMAPLDFTVPHSIPFTDLIHPTIIEEAAAKSTERVDWPVPAPGGRKWASAPTPLEAFIGAMLLRVRGLQRSFGLPDTMEMHDPVAIWYAISVAHLPAVGTEQWADGWGLNQRDFNVERIGELTRGMCVVDRRGSGESGGEDRTKGELGSGESSGTSKVEKGRMGEDLAKHQNLPWVMVQSTGKEVLRRMLLERVFGAKF